MEQKMPERPQWIAKWELWTPEKSKDMLDNHNHDNRPMKKCLQMLT